MNKNIRRSVFLVAAAFNLLFTLVSSTTNPIMKKTAPLIRSVAIVGGTHGNEYTGVFCIKALERQMKRGKQKYPFELRTLVGNPEAYMANKRFVDSDLNRQFTGDAMAAARARAAESLALSVEQKRAMEIDDLLGPKFSEKKKTGHGFHRGFAHYNDKYVYHLDCRARRSSLDASRGLYHAQVLEEKLQVLYSDTHS